MYHIVRASDGFHLIAKQPTRLSETYVDIRAFTMTDWAVRPQLASALVQADQQKLLGDSAAAALQEKAKQLLPDWPNKSTAPAGRTFLPAVSVSCQTRMSALYPIVVNLLLISARTGQTAMSPTSDQPHDPNRHH